MLNRRFRQMATLYLKQPGDPVDAYFSSQHYGLPTRLLDWTTNPMIALAFAADPPDDVDGLVFELSPSGRTYYQRYGPDGFKTAMADLPVSDAHEVFVGKLLYLYLEPVVNGVVFPLTGPTAEQIAFAKTHNFPLWEDLMQRVLPVIPSLRFERMKNQASRFTFHSPDCGNIESLVMRTLVPKGAKQELRELLRRMGLGRSTLFPDLSGVVDELVQTLRDDPHDLPWGHFSPMVFSSLSMA